MAEKLQYFRILVYLMLSKWDTNSASPAKNAVSYRAWEVIISSWY